METNNENTTERGSRRILQGTVTSNSMEKTIGVRVERMFRHPRYQKYIRRHDKYFAHDEEGRANVGDTVEIVECRPISKTKRWRLTSVIAEAIMDGGEI
jgi:small subunit ribosomal protein S17